MLHILTFASSQLGQKEIVGPEHNETIVGYAQDIGLDWVSDDETPWYAIFMSWCAKQAKLSYPKSALARSWMHEGNPTANPEPGDAVIFWLESIDSYKGHVGLFLGYSNDQSRVYCLGGNQGNQVSISAQPAANLLGFRRLKPSEIWKLPEVYLRREDSGNQVILLQDILKHLNYDVGTSDGAFGPRTEHCIKMLQANAGLTVDGIYGNDTKNFLNTLLNQ